MSQFDVGKTDGAEKQTKSKVDHRPAGTLQISLHARDRNAVREVSQRYGFLGLVAIYRIGMPSLGHTNEVIGAYVTAGARIHLYGLALDSIFQCLLHGMTSLVTSLTTHVTI